MVAILQMTFSNIFLNINPCTVINPKLLTSKYLPRKLINFFWPNFTEVCSWWSTNKSVSDQSPVTSKNAIFIRAQILSKTAKFEKKHHEKKITTSWLVISLTAWPIQELQNTDWFIDRFVQTIQRILRSYPYLIMHLKTNMEYGTNRNVYSKIKEIVKLSPKFLTGQTEMFIPK